MARRWTSLGRQLGSILPRTLGYLGTGVRRTEHTQRPTPLVEFAPGRPVASVLQPTAERARPVVYSPDLEGLAHAGEVVWTWTHVADDGHGRDLPVLVVGRDESTLLGLILSDDPARAANLDWVDIGTGTWDYEARPTWARIDHVLDVPEAGIRREGAVLDRSAFDRIAYRLCTRYRWH